VKSKTLTPAKGPAIFDAPCDIVFLIGMDILY